MFYEWMNGEWWKKWYVLFHLHWNCTSGTLPKRPQPIPILTIITMIPSLNWLIVHTNLRVKILVICNHYLARKQQSVGGNRNQGLWQCDEWNGKRTYIMSWCYLYPPRMLFLCPGCQVKMSDCLTSLISGNATFVGTGKNIVDIGVKERAKSLLQSVLKQLCGLECSQTIMYVLFGIRTRVLDTNEEWFYFLLFTILLAEGLTGGLKINRKCDINLTLRIQI